MKSGAYRIRGRAGSIAGGQVDLDGEYNAVVREHTNGLYADVANRVVGGVTIDERHQDAVVDALREQFPPAVAPFEADHCVSVGDLLRISEPIEFQSFIDGVDGPYVDKGTLRFILNYSFEHLDWLDRIYLIGSQASGVRGRGGPVSPQSDHDFVAVVQDNSPDEMETGCSEFSSFYNKMNAVRTRIGMNGIDIFVKKASSLEAEKDVAGTVGDKAMRGKLLAKRRG